MNPAQLWDKPWRPDVGFSGTREGMSSSQYAMLKLLLVALQPRSFHHGDCVGSDKQAHTCATQFTNAELHVHPGGYRQGRELVEHMRAHCQGDYIYPPQPFLDRNKTIVADTDLTIVTPHEAQPVLRSGTWATFRYSMGQLKPTVLIQPDGTLRAYSAGKEIMKTNVVSLYKGSVTTPWTSNGNGDAIVIHESPNGYLAFYASGTWDSGSLKLQVSPDDSGTVWIDVANSTMTADGYKIVQVFGRRLRGVLGSVATASSLTVKVAGVQTGVTVTNS